ncbi:helix-turn-helix domain-containing protein [Paenibacillus sp. Leaf72]|uniref:helix-turn-helix domain-containing protein n=1 Tax=Paenibacillus sp. Leaf72 TaxID=1736234 RepID=UPI0006F68BC7|nr:helix-turn-helix domain-containing protein [Paenibacillus sp. Leaf72]KQN96086.1 hypothetical protein ASF12_24980 [Paenibacillus sp. Leaf72]
MNNVKSFIMKRKLLLKMIFSYVAVGFILIGVFAYVIIDKVSDNLTEDVNQSVIRMTEQSYNTADILLTSTYNYFAKNYDNQVVYNAMYGGSFTYIEMKQINTLLSEMKEANPLIDSIYIYNLNNDSVFSSEKPITPIADFYDKRLTAMLKEKDFYKKGVFIPRNEKYTELAKSYEKNWITIVYSQFARNSIIDGALVVNLDQQMLQQLATKGSGSGSSIQSVIINDKGTVISHSNPSMVNKNLNEEPYIRTILDSTAESGQLSDTINNQSVFVSYFKSDRLGWSFIGIAENESLLLKVNHLKQFIVWMTAIFVLIAAATALFSIRMIYMPLNTIMKRVGSSLQVGLKDGSQLNEYELLTKSFSYLEGKVTDLQLDVSGYLPAKRKEVLRSVIQGGYTGLAGDKKLTELGLNLHAADSFQICVIRLDEYDKRLQQFDLADISLFKYAISNIAEEIITSPMQREAMDDNDDTIVLLLSWKDGELGGTAEVEQRMADIQSKVAQYLKLSVTIAIGPVVQTLKAIPLSWNQAYHSSRYRLICGYGTIIAEQGEAAIHAAAEHDYPLALEKHITDQMKLGDKAKFQQAVEQFFAEIRTYQYDEIMLYVYQLTVMAVRTSKGMVSEAELLQSGMLSLPETIQKQETLEHMITEFAAACRRVMSQRDHSSSQTNVKAVSLIEEQVRSGYADPNLSVEGLAEAVGLSTNYARKVFKDFTGKTISQYIADFRFDKAKELLLSTDLSAGKVGELVGMTNTNYFYASFKKHTGKSPVHYRKAYMLDTMLKDVKEDETTL